MKFVHKKKKEVILDYMWMHAPQTQEFELGLMLGLGNLDLILINLSFGLIQVELGRDWAKSQHVLETPKF